MHNINLHGKLLSVKGKVARTGRYMAYVTLFSRDFKRNKWQKYHITFFNQVAKDLVEKCKRNDTVRIIGDLINKTYPKEDGTLEIIGTDFQLTYWSEEDKRFIALQTT